jgi:hypothetical protein
MRLPFLLDVKGNGRSRLPVNARVLPPQNLLAPTPAMEGGSHEAGHGGARGDGLVLLGVRRGMGQQ